MSALEPLSNPVERVAFLPNAMNWRSSWDVATQYYVNDCVVSPTNGDVYLANRNSLGGNDPALDPAPSIWTNLSGVPPGETPMYFAGTWSATEPYEAGAVVVSPLSKQCFVALVAVPAGGSDPAPNNPSWQNLAGRFVGVGSTIVGNPDVITDAGLFPYPDATPLLRAVGTDLVIPINANQATNTNTLQIALQGFEVGSSLGLDSVGFMGLSADNLGAPGGPTAPVGYFNNTTQNGLPALTQAPLPGSIPFTQTICLTNGAPSTSSSTAVFTARQGIDYTPTTTSFRIACSSTTGAEQFICRANSILRADVIKIA